MASTPAYLHFACQVAFAPAHVHSPPQQVITRLSNARKCDRDCQCFIQAQLIWVIRPHSHCRNQRWSRTFPVGNMPCSCSSSVICKTAAVREVVLLNCVVHLTSELLGVQYTRLGFGCAGQVNAVAPPSFSSHSLDIVSFQNFKDVVRNFSCLSILGVEHVLGTCDSSLKRKSYFMELIYN